MVKKSVLSSLLAAFVLIGCGGGGGGQTPTSAGKAAVRRAISQAIAYNRNDTSGISRSGLHSSRRGRLFKAMSSSKRGSRDVADSYFDEDVQLWVTVADSADGLTITESYWTDEAATIPAGSRVIVYPSAAGYPNTTTTTINITAGPSAGTSGTVTMIHDDATSWHSSNAINWPDGSNRQGTDTLTSNGTASWTMTETYTNGTSFTSQGSLNPDHTGSMTTTGTDGVTTTMNFAADDSGDGTVTDEGPSEPAEPHNSELPADFSWTSDGTTTIRYADGSTETIRP